MFKKTKIAAATIALLGAVAAQNVSAVAEDESGTSAQVLIFPYYNVNNNFISMFNIRNTHNEFKAVKIRFRESNVSNDVLDYNIYMSPYDHYSFTLSRTATGGVLLRTGDSTCTYPTLPAEGKEFLDAYDATTTSDLREGYVEVIEMGSWPNSNSYDVDVDPGVSGTQSLFDGIKHVAPRPAKPKDCTVVATAWEKGVFTQGGALKNAVAPVLGGNGDWYMDSAVPGNFWGDDNPDHIYTPTGGLAGYSGLFNLTDGVIYADNATMIRNYQTVKAQHYRSDDENFYLLPSLASGNVTTALTQNVLGTGSDLTQWQGVVYDFSLVDPNLAPNAGVGSGINPFPISDVLAAVGLHNDYFMTPEFAGKTDWVITFPMRKHGIWNNYRFDGKTDSTRNANTTKNNASVKYFLYDSTFADVTFTYDAFDREEQKPTKNVGFSPAVKGDKSRLPREANVIQFNNEGGALSTGVLGTPADSAIKLTLQAGYTEGWAIIVYASGYDLVTLADGTFDATATLNSGVWHFGSHTMGQTSLGVPSIGFAAIEGGAAPSAVGETISHVFIK